MAFLDPEAVWGPRHLFEPQELIKRYLEAGMVSSTFGQALEGYDLFLNPAVRKIGMLEKIDFVSAGWKMRVVHSSSVALTRRVSEEVGEFGPCRMGADSEYGVRVDLRFPVAVSSLPTFSYMSGHGGVMETSKKEDPLALEASTITISCLESVVCRNPSVAR